MVLFRISPLSNLSGTWEREVAGGSKYSSPLLLSPCHQHWRTPTSLNPTQKSAERSHTPMETGEGQVTFRVPFPPNSYLMAWYFIWTTSGEMSDTQTLHQQSAHPHPRNCKPVRQNYSIQPPEQHRQPEQEIQTQLLTDMAMTTLPWYTGATGVKHLPGRRLIWRVQKWLFAHFLNIWSSLKEDKCWNGFCLVFLFTSL